ncbi:MAG: response regulator [Proteobacteria bacterium]|nr:response regulator [Pseudomonadota bacterium]MBU1640623.1 response regulator [Pseudomonadota bacterium]
MHFLTYVKLRTAIPCIILLFSLATGIIFLQSYLPRVNQNIEEDGRHNLQIRMTQIQRNLAYFLLRDNITMVQQQISVLSLDPRVRYVYLVCDEGIILAASDLGLINQPLTAVTPSLSRQEQELLTPAQQDGLPQDTHATQIHFSANRNALLSTTTLSMLPSREKPQGGHRHLLTHSHAHGHATLYLAYDLQPAKNAARQTINRELIKDSVFLVLLALALWSYFHLVVDRRLASLHTMAKKIGQGNYDAQSNISGNDELADLARTFEEMRDNLLHSFETIRLREESLQETQAIAHMGSWEFDILSRQLWWSEETYHIFCFEPCDTITFEKFLGALHPDDRDGVEEAINSSISQARGVSLDYRIVIDADTVRYLHEESQVVVDDTGRVIRRKGSVQDISERHAAEVAMERSAREWAVAMDASDDVIYLLTPDRHLIRANRLFYELTGSTPKTACGRHIVELIHPHGETVLCPVCKAQEERRDTVITMEGNHPDNPAGRPLEVTIKIVRDKKNQPLSMLVTIHDLTSARQDMEERSKLERQLQQAQKMEAVGTLAGGIAHDFNNILTPIIGYTEMALWDLPPEGKTAQKLNEVLQASQRAKDLVSQILSFSRQDDQDRHPLEIQLVLKEALKLLRASIPTTIDIKTTLDQQCGPVLANPTQIHQIIMNLCTNAYHAMRETGGVITVALSQLKLGPHELADNADLKAGKYVLLEISDTGHGMSREICEKIFDPYFTTKAKGEGTGLGLSVVHGIVKHLDGYISVASELDRGTTFHIYLPVSEDNTKTPKSLETAALPGGQEHILVVDDEESITRLLKMSLESLGYQVTVFTTPETALNAFKAQPQAFDLLITDMTMPHITGDQLSKEILALRPDMPIIMCTGFSTLISAKQAAEIGIRKFLMKPVVKKDLAHAIREVLDKKISS